MTIINNNIHLPNPFPGMVQLPHFNVAPVNKTVDTGVKAGKNGTHITIILDESGSMASCRDATISGFNEFVLSQKNNTIDNCYLTLVKFNGNDVLTVFKNIDIREVPVLTHNEYTPNGWTNLFDAIGITLKDIDVSLKSKKKKYRPSELVVIMTDGAENSSRQYDNETVKAMVKGREEKDWAFMFLGANIDAFAAGASIGMGMSNTAQYSTNNMAEVMCAVSDAATTYRGLRAQGLASTATYNSLISDEDRKKMK